VYGRKWINGEHKNISPWGNEGQPLMWSAGSLHNAGPVQTVM